MASRVEVGEPGSGGYCREPEGGKDVRNPPMTQGGFKEKRKRVGDSD
jgi:hypothetical protein